jgi:hypothetical protein
LNLLYLDREGRQEGRKEERQDTKQAHVFLLPDWHFATIPEPPIQIVHAQPLDHYLLLELPETLKD